MGTPPIIVSKEIQSWVGKIFLRIQKKLDNFCKKMKIQLEPSKDFEVLGPAPPYISFLRGKYRKRFIIRCQRNKNIQEYVNNWLSKSQKPFDLKISVDIDPYNFS